ncbi:MAG: amidohydrolase family protein [Oscillospiraceae bacterium]|jgi:predicted TIM-barrel fold metal-dependent hydrolase|nr:amidohydrolase family protein [Oscillospiraceae bacterium]
MPIIDTHAHIFPPKIERVATRAIADFYERPMRYNGAVETLLAAGKRAGVDRHLVFSTATTAAQVTRINDYILEQVAEHPEFIGAGTMQRDFGDFERELTRIHDAGIRGIKLHPDFQKFDIDDPKMLPIFECVQALGMFVVTHSGDYRYTFSHPERVRKIADMFPKIDVVAAHFGGWSMWDKAAEAFRGADNVYFDTSSTYGFIGLRETRRILDRIDAQRVFFGCDFPMWDHDDELRMIRHLKLPDRVVEDITGGNFARFLDGR